MALVAVMFWQWIDRKGGNERRGKTKVTRLGIVTGSIPLYVWVVLNPRTTTAPQPKGKFTIMFLDCGEEVRVAGKNPEHTNFMQEDPRLGFNPRLELH